MQYYDDQDHQEADFDYEEFEAPVIDNAVTNLQDGKPHETQHIVVPNKEPVKNFGLYDNISHSELDNESKDSDPEVKSDVMYPGKVRYFMVCSKNENNMRLAIQRGMWATLPKNEETLNNAFKTCDTVIFFFYVIPSGSFHGYAKMTSLAEKRDGPSWTDWGTPFTVKWQRLFDLSYEPTKHILNPWANNKPIGRCRDGTEIEPNAANELLLMMDRGCKFERRVSSRLLTEPVTLEDGTTVYPRDNANRRRKILKHVIGSSPQGQIYQTYPPPNAAEQLPEVVNLPSKVRRKFEGPDRRPQKRLKRSSNFASTKAAQYSTTRTQNLHRPLPPTVVTAQGFVSPLFPSTSQKTKYETYGSNDVGPSAEKVVINGFVIEKDQTRELTPPHLHIPPRRKRRKASSRDRDRKDRDRRRRRRRESRESYTSDDSESESEPRRRRRRRRSKTKEKDLLQLLQVQQNLQQLALLKILSTNPSLAQALQQPDVDPKIAEQLIAQALLQEQLQHQ